MSPTQVYLPNHDTVEIVEVADAGATRGTAAFGNISNMGRRGTAPYHLKEALPDHEEAPRPRRQWRLRPLPDQLQQQIFREAAGSSEADF